MASYTTSLRLIQPATGEYPGSWGTQANNGLTALVDTSVAGTATITMVAADYTLSTANGATDEARAAVLNVTGTPGAARNIIVPAVSKIYVVFNNTTGGFAQTVKTSAGTGISVPNGASAYLRCNGTDVVEAVNYFGSLSVGTVTGGTFVSPSLTGTPTAPTAAGGTSTTQIATTAYVATNFAGLSSPAFTGTPTVPTAAPGTNTTQAASTAFVATSFAPLASPAFTGVPTAPTATAGVSTTQVATTAFVAATAFSSVLPGQTGNAGKYVTTDGTNASWAEVYPSQTGNNGKFISTNGSNVSWESINLATSITGTLPVGNGGTGASTLALNNVLLGNGTAPLQTVAPGTSGNILLSNGTTWSSSAFPVITDPAKVPTTLTANSAGPYYTGLTYTFNITNLDDYTTYTLSTTNGTILRSGATLSYTPSSVGPGGWLINGRAIGLTIQTYTNFIEIISGGSGRSVGTDSSNNIYVNGYSANNWQISKLSSIGVIQWSRQLTVLGSNTTPGPATADSAGNAYLAGSASSGGFAWVAKYNTSGVIQWQRTLAGTGMEWRGIAIDSAQSVIVVGNNTNASVDSLIAKYNSSGVIQWQKNLGTGGVLDYFQKVSTDSSNNIFAGGYLNTFPRIAKYNSSGTLQWQILSNLSSNYYVQGIANDSAGNVIVGIGGGGANVHVNKLDTSGALTWQVLVSGTLNNVGAVTVDSSSNIYVVCNGSANDFHILKFNSSGVLQWQRTLSSTSTDTSYGIVVDASGDVQVSGSTGSSYLLARLPADGSKTGTYTVGGVSFTYSASAFTTSTPGNSWSASGSTDAASTLTDAAGAYVDSAATLTASITPI
jgi:hypothetical protein